MAITLDLTPDTEARLRQKADTEGLDVKEYLRRYFDALPKVMAADYGRLFARPLTDEEVQARLALLDEFSRDSEEYDDAAEGDVSYEEVLRNIAENPFSLREYRLDD